MASPDVVSMIRFKNNSAELSDTEMDKLMSRLWRTVGRNRMLQFLCASLPNIATNGKYHYADLLPTASDIISKIIEEREPEDEQINPIKLTHLPSSLVGEIASNLQQPDNISFSKTNRKLFIDSNSPNRLRRMILIKGNYNYSALRLEHFRQIKHLSLSLNRVSELYAFDNEIFNGNNRIESMAIDCTDAQISDFDSFIYDQSLCFRTIKKLVMISFKGNCGIGSLCLRGLLQKFEGLESLRMVNLEIYGHPNENDLQTICPVLSKLHIIIVDPISPFLTSWASNITTLTVVPMYKEENSIQHCDLSSVKRVHFAMLEFTQSVALLNMASKATEIAFVPSRGVEMGQSLEDSMTGQEAQRVINLCFMRPNLEYFYVSAVYHIESIISAVVRGLNDSKQIERECLEIVLNVDIRTVSRAETFVPSVIDIVKAFIGSKVKEWIFVLKSRKVSKDSNDEDTARNTANDINELRDALRELETLRISVELCASTDGIIVILTSMFAKMTLKFL